MNAAAPKRDAPAADQMRELLNINFSGSPWLGEVPKRLNLIHTNGQEYTFFLKNNCSVFTGDSPERQSPEPKRIYSDMWFFTNLKNSVITLLPRRASKRP